MFVWDEFAFYIYIPYSLCLCVRVWDRFGPHSVCFVCLRPFWHALYAHICILRDDFFMHICMLRDDFFMHSILRDDFFKKKNLLYPFCILIAPEECVSDAYSFRTEASAAATTRTAATPNPRKVHNHT